MTISDSDAKILWGRAAGICSNPTCRADLTAVLEQTASYNIGEMAHIIARKPAGPRGAPGGGPDTYANLIRLCPSCHRHIDKSPAGTYPEAMLHEWKRQHEEGIRAAGADRKFSTLEDLKQYVAPLLSENKALWKHFGPQSESALADPGSNVHIAWALRKIDRIVPNNRRILNAVEANRRLLGPRETEAAVAFRIHASAFETNQYRRLDTYPTFPAQFEECFSK